MLFQLLFLLIAACSAQALPAGSPKKPGMPGVTPSSKMADLSVLGKLRQEMVQVRTPPPRPPILAPRLLPLYSPPTRTATATVVLPGRRARG